MQMALSPLVLQASPHPEKYEVAAGVSVRVTRVAPGKLALHVCGQFIPDGLLVTVPFPERLTVNVTALGLNVAVTDWLALSVTMQVGLKPHPPPVQPAKVEFAAAVAVRVT